MIDNFFILQVVMGGALVWTLKQVYSSHACISRLEQKIDSFITDYYERKKSN